MHASPSISRIIALTLPLFTALLCIRCDFPSDPPLKSVITEPPIVEPTDSTEVLLPLNAHVHWVYIFENPPRPPSPPRYVIPRALSFESNRYFYVPYFSPAGTPGGPHVAFPVLLRNDSLGLSFYQPVRDDDTTTITLRPKFMFTLPYPGRVGKTYPQRNPEFAVRLTHKDTLISMYGQPVSLPCRRYELWRGPRLATVFYIVPGLCILRIEDDDRLFHTVGWSI